MILNIRKEKIEGDMEMKKSDNRERGSLALEQILFIAAVVIMGGFIAGFYQEIGDYFDGASFAAPPTNIGDVRTSNTAN